MKNKNLNLETYEHNQIIGEKNKYNKDLSSSHVNRN